MNIVRFSESRFNLRKNFSSDEMKETDGNSNYKSCELSELAQEQFLENVHLTFNLEAGLLLPFVLKYN